MSIDTSFFRKPTATVRAIALFIIAGSAGEIARARPLLPPPDARDLTNLHYERPQDRQVETAGARGQSPRAIIPYGLFTSYQVNIDLDAMNVLDDAANEPSIAVDPIAPNRIAAGWRQFDTITSNHREAGYSASIDGGRNWTPASTLEVAMFRSDPVLASAPDGTFYYLSLRHNAAGNSICDLFVSSDHGATWPDRHYAMGGDKAWLAVDPHSGHLYQAWNIHHNLFAPAQFSRSTDGGLTWDNPVAYEPFRGVPVQPVNGTIAVGPNGAVYVIGARNLVPTDTFWFIRSTNAHDPQQTVSFDLIRTVDLGGALTIGAAPNPGGLIGQVNVGVDASGGPFHGTIYIIAPVVPVLGNDPMDIHVARSVNGGFSWLPPARINDDAGGPDSWQWFAAMDVAPDGRVDVVWNDTRNTVAPNMCQLYYSYSYDGGETWANNIAVTPVFDSHLGWPNQQKLGDYYSIVSDRVGAHVLYAATFNGEQDVYYVRLGDHDCNVNGVGDFYDIFTAASFDCNGNDIPDECEIAAGALEDLNQNGVPDVCQPCIADLTDTKGMNQSDGIVNIGDLFALLSNWNMDGPPAELALPPDVCDVFDLFVLLGSWGECPK